MLLPERHRYDLYLRSVGGDAVVFGGRSQLYAGLLALSAALLLALYAVGVWRLPFQSFGAALHVAILGGAFCVGAGAFWMLLRREKLVLRRDGDKAVYDLRIGGRRYRWESPLAAFSAVSAELIAKSDGKAVGRRYWAFHLDRWDGMRVTFTPTLFAALQAKEVDRAANLVRSLGAFLGCEVHIADETRISLIGEEAARALPPGSRPLSAAA